MERVDCVVVGAGVIGLAVARELARKGREVLVLEANGLIGSETSSRNSEVIHAGIYYPKDSLKARFCVAGKHALYRYCETHGVPCSRLGKLIVAADDGQIGILRDLKRRAANNGVDDLTFVERDGLRQMEPEIAGSAALLSPSTGIIDSHAFMLSLQGVAEAHGGVIAFHAPVVGGRLGGGDIELVVGGEYPMDLRCRALINCAGLKAPDLALRLEGLPPETVPTPYYAKGNYFTLTGRSPFSHLIYPVPEGGGLGVHLTIDLGGQARFGPDVQWIDQIDYDVDPGRGDVFYEAIRRYWPDLRDGVLQPGYAGIRPKLAPAGAPAADFVIHGPTAHGVAGLVNLYGIESPGLTSALAIAEHVASMIPG